MIQFDITRSFIFEFYQQLVALLITQLPYHALYVKPSFASSNNMSITLTGALVKVLQQAFIWTNGCSDYLEALLINFML